MIALIIATICAALFSILFKVFQMKGIDSMKAILINYVVAFAWGWLFSMRGTGFINPIGEKWFIPSLILGVVFIRGMVLLNLCTEKVGVAISTVCSRASMVITIIFCYLALPGSAVPKWPAIAVALISLTMIVSSDMRGTVGGQGKRHRSILLATVVFLIFGLSNSMLKWIQYIIDREYGYLSTGIVDSMNAAATSVIFLTALFIAICTEIFKKIRYRNDREKSGRFSWGELAGGFAFGSANFFCTYLLVVAMKDIDSSVLFPVHNAGIVAVGALAGWALFKEKLTAIQITGIAVSILAIAWLCI